MCSLQHQHSLLFPLACYVLGLTIPLLYCCSTPQNLKFSKAIRYESRKQLAQQRPRMKGQFVKHPKASGSTTPGDQGVNVEHPDALLAGASAGACSADVGYWGPGTGGGAGGGVNGLAEQQHQSCGVEEYEDEEYDQDEEDDMDEDDDDGMMLGKSNGQHAKVMEEGVCQC